MYIAGGGWVFLRASGLCLEPLLSVIVVLPREKKTVYLWYDECWFLTTG